MKIKYLIFLLAPLTVLFYSCGNTSEIQKKEISNSELQIDNSVNSDSSFIEEPFSENSNTEGNTIKEAYYLVQIGAFTTLEKAQAFAEISKKMLKKELSVSKNISELYIVQVNEKFLLKQDAQDYRDAIKNLSNFKDAWIVVVH